MKQRILTTIFLSGILSFFFFTFHTEATGNIYYFNNAIDESPSEVGNYWNNEGADDPAGVVPDFSVDEVTILSGATFDNEGTINDPAVFNGSAANNGEVTGDATFNDTSANMGTIDGNAEFFGDGSEATNDGTILGTRTRHYTSDTVSSRDFTNGTWIIIADGAFVDLSGSSIDENTILETRNEGSFNYIDFLYGNLHGSTLTLFYNNNGDLDSGSVPAGGDYIVKVNGNPVTVSNVTVSGNKVILTLASSVISMDAATLDYTKGVNPVRSDVGHINVANLVSKNIPVVIATGRGPVYSTLVGTELFVSNNIDNTVSVIDTNTDTVVDTIPVGGQPYYSLAIGNKLYVNNSNTSSSSVSVINTTTHQVIATIPVVSGPYYSTLVGTKLYVNNYASGDIVSVIDTTTDQVVASPVVGPNPYYSISVGTKLYVSFNTVFMIDTTNDIPTEISGSSHAYYSNSIGDKVYLINSDNSVSVIDTNTDTITDNIVIGVQTGSNIQVACAVGSDLYVNKSIGNSVVVIDTTTNTIRTTIPVGLFPFSCRTIGDMVYISNQNDSTVSVIDTKTDTVVDTLYVGHLNQFSTVVGSKLYVNNFGGDSVSVIDTTTIPSQLPNLVNFTTTASNGTYRTGEVIPITAHFGRPLLAGSTMTVHLNSGGSATLSTVSGNTLSGTYTVLGGHQTPDLSIDSITSASVTDSTNTYTRTSYDLPSSQGNFEAENSFITRNLGDSKNIVIGSFESITTGSNPYQVSAPVNGYIYVANQGSNTVSVVKVSDSTVVATIPVGSEPYGLSYANGNMYVANTGSDTVSVIDTSTNTVIATVAAGVKPYYVATIGTKVYVTNGASNTVSVINALNNTVTATITVGSYPRGIKAHGTDLYVANYGDDNYSGGNYISVIDSLTNEVSDTVILPGGSSGPRGVVVNGNKVYVTNFRSNNVSVINTATNTIIATIPVGVGPRGTATLGTKVYIENFDDGTISVIDTTTDTVTATVDVGHSPAGMGVSGTDIYLSRFQDNELSILDTTTNTLQALPVVVPPSSGGGNGGGGGVVIIPQTTPVIPVTVPTTSPPQMPEIHTFTDHLRLYSRSSDVIYLQKYLNTHGFLIAKSGPGSPGKETDYFGALTKAALVRFQKTYKLVPDGVFGPVTRGRVNSTP